MQEIRTGFVVWTSDIGVPVVFFIVELPGGVGAVLMLDKTTQSEINTNKASLLKQGYVVIEETREQTTITTMLPDDWDREATIVACDQYADLWITEQERNIRGGNHVN